MGPLLVAAALAALSSDASDWPQWRGLAGDGLSHGAAWSAEGTTLWKAEIGLGYSAPSVSHARVFAFGFDVERSLDVLRALELETGAELWRAEWPGELRANQHEGGTLSTPAADERFVVTSTSSGVVACRRAASGELVWSQDLARDHELDPQYYGFAGSPLLAGEQVVVALDRVFALELETGAPIWKSEPLDARYATPALCRRGEVPCLAVFSQQALHLLERAGGSELGRFPWLKADRRVNAATPVVVGDQLFISSAYDFGCALVDFSGEAPRAVWENRAMRNKMAGCVLVDGALFGFDESILKCLDLAGEERWRVRGFGNGALSGGDGKLALVSSSGELVVARATPDAFQELARVALFDAGVCWTPPAIAGGRILVRNNRGTLVCRDHRARAPEGAASAAARPQDELPAAETLFERHLAAIGGAEALRAHPHVRLRGTYEQRSVGFVPVPFEIAWSAPDRRRVDIQFPPPLDGMFAQDGVPGRLSRVHDGTAVFELNPYRGDKLYPAAEEREERVAARLGAAGEWRALYTAWTTTAAVELDGRACYRVEATTREGTRRTLHFERATGLLARREAEDEAIVTYRDYRAFDGLLLPTVERVFRPEGGIEETFRVDAVEFVAPDEALFARPESIATLLAERAAAAGAEPR